MGQWSASATRALARIDPGRGEGEEALRWAAKGQDPALRGMAGIPILVREQRLSGRRPSADPGTPRSWFGPITITAGALALLELGSLLGTQAVTPGTILPVLFLTPVLAFLAGVAFAVATRHLRRHPAIGGGVTGWLGASTGLLTGLLLPAAMTPAGVVLGGCLALGSGAFGGTLVRTALVEL